MKGNKTMTHKEVLEKLQETRIKALRKIEKDPKDKEFKEITQMLSEVISGLESLVNKKDEGLEIYRINEIRKKYDFQENKGD